MADVCDASPHPQPGAGCTASIRIYCKLVEAPGVEPGSESDL